MALSIAHRFVSAKADSSDNTLIQPSHWNADHVVSGFPFNNVKDFDFTHQAPTENLSPVLRTVTLTAVPKGVNGADAKHYLAIYDNAGVFQEAVLINGGSAVSEATTGNVTFAAIVGTYAAGTYKIGSATAGLQEAIIYGGTYASIFLETGTYNIYAQVNCDTLPFITGQSIGYPVLNKCFTTGNVLDFSPSGPTAFFGVRCVNFQIGSGIADTSGYAIALNGANYGLIQAINIYRVSAGREQIGGIQLNNALSIFINAILMVGLKNGGKGLYMTGMSTAKVCDIEIGSFGTTADLVYLSGQIQSTSFNDLYLQGGGNNIKVVVPSTGYFNEINFVNCTFDSATGAAFSLSMQAGGSSQKVSFTNIVLGSLAYCINIDGTNGSLYEWNFTNVVGGSNVATGLGVIYLKNVNAVTITSCELQGATTAAGDNALYLDATTENITVIGCKLGFTNNGVTGAGQSNYGVVFNTGTHNRVTMVGNAINGATAPMILVGTLTNAVIADNNGVSNVRPTIASGNTIAPSATQFNDIFFISGNTVIKTITASGAGVPVWDGKKLTLIFTHATPAGVDATGNIAAAIAPSQNRSIPLVYDLAATKWYPMI